MTVALPSTWQMFRLGLHVAQSHQAARFTLGTTFSARRPPIQLSRCFGSVSGFRGSTPNIERSQSFKTPAFGASPTFDKLRKGSKCISFWKKPSKEEAKEETAAEAAESEIVVTPAEVDKIFGRKINPEKGLEILSTLQNHRLQGTLDHEMPYNATLITKGLAWLRKENPIDEDAAIIARIDRETDRVPQTSVERSPQSISQFEKLRELNKEKAKVEAEKLAAEEEKKKLEQGNESPKEMEVKGKNQTSPSNDLVKLRPEPEWVRNYREKATNHDERIIEISTWARLVPSAAVLITVVGLSLLFAQNYTPPSRDARMWSNMPPAAATLLTIVCANGTVFLMWRIPQFWTFMNKNFLVAPVYPHAMSMLGAPFSHQQFTHLFANCMGLWLIGTRVHDDIGRGPFLAIFFASAVIAAYIPMAVYVLRKDLIATTLGASGIVSALIATGCVLHEGLSVTVPFLPPEWTRGIDTGVMLAILMFYEAWCIRKRGITPTVLSKEGPNRPHIDNMGHLTGYTVGIVSGAAIRSTDPYWKNRERHHFLTKDFGKTKEQQKPTISPPR